MNVYLIKLSKSLVGDADVKGDIVFADDLACALHKFIGSPHRLPAGYCLNIICEPIPDA